MSSSSYKTNSCCYMVWKRLASFCAMTGHLTLYISVGMESGPSAFPFRSSLIAFWASTSTSDLWMLMMKSTYIAKGCLGFGLLCELVLEKRDISIGTKWKMYAANVLPILLYTCETWAVYECHPKKFNHFHMNCLRKPLKRTWEVQIWWASNCARMPDVQLPNRIFYIELVEGKCMQGEQKKYFKDTLKASP